MNKKLLKSALLHKKQFFTAIVLSVLLTLMGCGTEAPLSEDNTKDGTANTQNTENTETNGKKQDNTDEIKEAESTIPPEEDVIDEPSEEGTTRDNSEAALTTLNTGNFVAGIDIPAGRYTITGKGSGNLFINSQEGDLKVNEILGDYGVKKVTTDLEEADTIEISGIKEVTFTPYETVLQKDTLTTGNWVVGLDIAPGRYDASSTGGNGNLFVYDKMGLPVVNEILGGGDYGVDKVTVDLKDGYEISIYGMNEVKFEPR